MFDLDRYLNALILSCRAAFGKRLLYVGLQGSWLRGEAHEGSDMRVERLAKKESALPR